MGPVLGPRWPAVGPVLMAGERKDFEGRLPVPVLSLELEGGISSAKAEDRAELVRSGEEGGGMFPVGSV